MVDAPMLSCRRGRYARQKVQPMKITDIHKLARVAALAGVLLPTTALAQEASTARDVTFKQVAPDLYFLFEFTSSNAVVLTTTDGVLVIDTRQHPRDGQDLLERIRKLTDKPVRWVINSHFHGDHHFGNAPFKAAGATFVAQSETARIMAKVQPKEMARRGNLFKSRG